MKKVLSLLLAVIMIVSIVPLGSLAAEISATETSDDGLWEYSFIDDETIEINRYLGNDYNLTIPFDVDGYLVTSIGDNCFLRKSIYQMTLHNYISNIGNKAFLGCKSLESITIPNSVTSIGEEAFRECTSLSNITISNSVTSIPKSAFYGCSALKSVIIPDGVTSIGWSAFGQCEKLADIVIPNSVATISNYAFYSCKSLTSIKIPEGVKSIYEGVFSNCTNIESIIIPESVTYIGEAAFEKCNSLKSIKIPNNVTKIGERAFDGCSSLKSVFISNLESWCSISIGRNTISQGYSLYINNKLSTDIVIPGNTTEIKSYAFYHCDSIKNAIIPEGVKSISGNAFACCTSLQSVTIPDSVTSIDENAFYSSDCTIKCSCNSYAYKFAKSNGIKLKAISNHSFNSDGFCSVCHTWSNSVNAPSIKSVKNVSNGVELIWDTINYADGYYVYRKTGDATKWTKIATVTGSSYKDTKVKTGTKYTYTVKGYQEDIYSNYNTKGVSVLYLAMPTVKTANVDAGINIAWTKVSGAKGYYVYRKTSGGKYSLISTTSANSFLDKKVKSGVSYIYAIRAYSGNTRSAYYDKSVLRLATPKVKVSNVKLGVNVSWSAINGADSYCIYRKTTGGSYTQIASVCDGLNYIDTNAKAGTAYIYAVKAYSGNSGCSSSFKAVGIVRLTIPSVKLARVSAGHKIAWSKVAGAKGYYIYRKTDTGSYLRIATTTSLSYVDKTAKANVQYYYTVRAYYGKYLSAYRNYIADTPIAHFEYSVYSDYCVITGYTGSASTIKIPTYIKGRPVTEIGWYAFDKNDTIVNVTIPSTVKKIDEGAFDGCRQLTTITIPNSVTSIKGWAFRGCVRLNKVTLSSNLKYIEKETFYNCKSLTSIVIPNKVIKIKERAFENCTSLTAVTIPISVTDIYDNAFFGCSSLSQVYYSGTSSQWKEIVVDDYNTSLTNARIVFNS